MGMHLEEPMDKSSTMAREVPVHMQTNNSQVASREIHAKCGALPRETQNNQSEQLRRDLDMSEVYESR